MRKVKYGKNNWKNGNMVIVLNNVTPQSICTSNPHRPHRCMGNVLNSRKKAEGIYQGALFGSSIPFNH